MNAPATATPRRGRRRPTNIYSAAKQRHPTIKKDTPGNHPILRTFANISAPLRLAKKMLRHYTYAKLDADFMANERLKSVNKCAA